MVRKIISLDFDGVVHSYTSPWVDEETIPDPPVDGAFAFMRRAIEKFDIVIHTSRGRSSLGRYAVEHWMKRWAQATFPNDWHWISRVRVVPHKPAAHLSIDDRGYQFNGEFPDLEYIESFVPWNKLT